jgi:DNA mismatch repair protein MutS
MSLITEYFELTKKFQDEYGENTILLMQVGAFFEVYGIYDKENDIVTSSRITDFSQICEFNIVDKNTCVGKNNVMMAGFKDLMIEKYLRKIQDAGFTAVVYTQDENVKNTSRSLAGIFSPGTYFQTESQNLTNSICCIWVNLIENKVLLKGKYVIVGAANIDIYTGKTSIFQFKETYVNNPTTYDELERFISIYNPSEVILISNLPLEQDLDCVISYAGISCALIHKIHINDNISNDKINIKITRVKNCEKQPYQKEILSKFYKFDSFDVFIQNFYENNIATQAFCYLLDFVYQHNPQLVHKISEPVFENCSNRLTLANHSLKQLNIIDDGTVKTSKMSSVSALLNNCSTPMGKRKFKYNILNPIYDETVLRREYDITEYIVNNFDSNICHHFKTKLTHIKDLAKFERQIFLKKISPKSINALFSSIKTIYFIFEIIKNDETIMNYLKNFDVNIKEVGCICNELILFIENNIDLDLAKDIDHLQQFEMNFIKKGVDGDLDKKTETLKDSEKGLESIREYLSNLIENKEKKGLKSSEFVKIHETEKNNYSLLCTSRRCKILQDVLPSDETSVTLNMIMKPFTFIVSKSRFSFEKQSSANNLITDSQIDNFCKTISSIKISMKDLITLVYNRFVESLSGYQNQLEKIINFITLIDVIYAKGSIAKQFNYCKPEIIEAKKACVEAKGLRHCLIERFQLNELYVSNDIYLGDGKSDGILLYGTNAVGKTTLIRALGISIILAQAGLYVPCSSFRFKPYRHIFTRIIGNDNIFKGLSTFEVEMSELRTILRLMDENSLILGDELCSGTETVSATSIFVAGIQKLHASRSSFIFATHLHEIVEYEEITSLQTVHLKHMEVKYDKENDVLVYDRKLKDGPGNSLYGLEVCKSLNLPQDFLEAANDIRLKYNPEGRSILSLKQSRYNSNKIVSTCEKCGKSAGTEVHHLQHQASADENGIIQTIDTVFHKNNLANLMTLCEMCHNEIHKTNTKQKRVKTTKGTVLSKI